MISSFAAQRLALIRAHDAFLLQLALFPAAQRDQPGVCGTWSAREVVAHLIGWDSALTYFLRDPGGFDPQPLDDVDTFNAHAVAARRQQTWTATVSELRAEFARLQAALNDEPGEMAILARALAWMTGRTADYQLHCEQLAIWLNALPIARGQEDDNDATSRSLG